MCQRPKIQKGGWYVFGIRPIISKILNEIVYEENECPDLNDSWATKYRVSQIAVGACDTMER